MAGSVALEWSLVAPALIVLLVGGIDLGRYMFTAQSVRELSGIVSRAAMIDPALAGCTAPKALAARTPMLSDPAKLTVCVTRSAGNGTTNSASIEVRYDFAFLVTVLAGRVSQIRETQQLIW
ncbi:TadE/TadG family type IV pilus assembly protein [Falsiroseomonas tokyonensis]|uniref:TadE/TadG family type IV pilus assembly protein n=1 Tax=Falsiroseomonas tokyonensis TaxID=430521 RepID=A0ABV7BP30_9PROT|nr:pilus assembly protein [Falsiroseomonas tokyonensis]